MLHWIGGVILVGSAAGMGILLERAEKKRLAALRLAEEMVIYAERQIALYLMPYDALFAHYPFPPGYSGKVETIVNKLEAQMGEAGSILAHFFATIGCMGHAETVRFCTETIEELHSAREVAEKRYASQKRLYIALPILAALSLLVFLI